MPPTGIIHVESPVQWTYTLGNFFDVWGQPLGPGQAGPATSRVVALYDGKVYRGNPRHPLTAHVQFQLDRRCGLSRFRLAAAENAGV